MWRMIHFYCYHLHFLLLSSDDLFETECMCSSQKRQTNFRIILIKFNLLIDLFEWFMNDLNENLLMFFNKLVLLLFHINVFKSKFVEKKSICIITECVHIVFWGFFSSFFCVGINLSRSLIYIIIKIRTKKKMWWRGFWNNRRLSGRKTYYLWVTVCKESFNKNSTKLL